MMTNPSQQPPITERLLDGVTDAQYTVAQASERLRIAAARLRATIEQTRSNSIITTVEACTRAHPLPAVIIAFMLGAYVFRRR